MAALKGRYWLSFGKSMVTRPVIWEMSKKFDVVFNIRQASVTKDMGVVAIELEGDRQTIKDAVAWLESEGIEVEPVELQTIEG